MTQEQFQKAEVIRENLRMIDQAHSFITQNEAENIELTRMMTFNSRNYVEALVLMDGEFKMDVINALNRLKQRLSQDFEKL